MACAGVATMAAIARATAVLRYIVIIAVPWPSLRDSPGSLGRPHDRLAALRLQKHDSATLRPQGGARIRQ